MANSILEHLQYPIKTLKELIRISKDNAIIKVLVPHANSYANITDLQHKNNFTENTFSKTCLREYELEQVELIKIKFIFNENKWKKCIPFKKYLKIYFNGIYDNILFEFIVKK